MEHRVNSWFMPIITVSSVLIAIGLAYIGSGAAVGTPVSEAAGGALSADATPFAPDGPAFSIYLERHLRWIAGLFDLSAPPETARLGATRSAASLGRTIRTVECGLARCRPGRQHLGQRHRDCRPPRRVDSHSVYSAHRRAVDED